MQGPEVLVPIIFFIAVAAIFITYISARHRERMAMVEKGLTTDEIKAYFTREIRRDPFSALKWGLLFISVGLAVVLGNFLRTYYFVEEGVIIGLVCLFAGFALLVYYGIASKKEMNV